MAEILMAYTGGTICSFEEGGCRNLDTSRAKRLIESLFFEHKSEYCKEDVIFKDSGFKERTLSENMTRCKLWRMAEHIKSFDLSKFRGIIILHGTDTLAYTASFLSFVLSDTKIPIMLVSGHKPPNEEGTNANVNFATAVKLIVDGIAPNIYVPYRNTDGRMWLHTGATLRQCQNFSDDFENADVNKKFSVSNGGFFEKCRDFSVRRKKWDLKLVSDRKVLKISPYTGLDYENISLDNVGAVIHGTYHSGTVCVERNDSSGEYGSESVLWLAEKCRERKIPLFIAPSKLSKEQYSSVFDAVENGGIVPLHMTTEAAYGKAVLGIGAGLSEAELEGFMRTEINNEFV